MFKGLLIYYRQMLAIDVYNILDSVLYNEMT